MQMPCSNTTSDVGYINRPHSVKAPATLYAALCTMPPASVHALHQSGRGLWKRALDPAEKRCLLDCSASTPDSLCSRTAQITGTPYKRAAFTSVFTC